MQKSRARDKIPMARYAKKKHLYSSLLPTGQSAKLAKKINVLKPSREFLVAGGTMRHSNSMPKSSWAYEAAQLSTAPMVSIVMFASLRSKN